MSILLLIVSFIVVIPLFSKAAIGKVSGFVVMLTFKLLCCTMKIGLNVLYLHSGDKDCSCGELIWVGVGTAHILLYFCLSLSGGEGSYNILASQEVNAFSSDAILCNQLRLLPNYFFLLTHKKMNVL